MSDEKVLNTQDILRQSTKSDAELQKDLNTASAKMKAQTMVDLIIPEAYRGAFGDPVNFSVNGVSVEIPIGKKVQVSESHARHAQILMKGATISKNQKRLTPEELYKD